MKRIAGLMMALVIGVVSANIAFAEGDPSPSCCCKVVITGVTMSCGGFYIPNSYVELQGDLRTKGNYAPYATSSDSLGRYGFVSVVPLNNYGTNKVQAFALLEAGMFTKIYYWGESENFAIHCLVIGQSIQCNIQIPMWVI